MSASFSDDSQNAKDARCEECGSAIPSESESALCPRCLLGFAFVEQEPIAPKQFGNYLLGETIGRGGMGIVYRARHEKLDRTVALKMIVGGELASPEALRRFRVETEAAADLDHPNIVPIFEVGDVDELPYFTMRFIEGGSLADRIAGFVPGEDARAEQQRIGEFLSVVAGAVAHAHEHGILHRDLKPTNSIVISSRPIS